MVVFVSDTDKFVASYAARADGCLEWQKAKNAYGYGVMRCGDGKNRLAHRFAWTLYFGDPKNQCVLHRCDNPRCVNVAHLFLGSQSDNMADKQRKNRHKWGNKIWAADEIRPWARLTAEQVLRIRADKRPQTAIAADFGVTQQTVSDIKRRRRWAHLEGH